MNADGTRQRRLTRTPAAEGFPGWSPDATAVSFYRKSRRGADVYVKPVAGGRARRITGHRANDYDPAWSPDGTRIAFVSDRSGIARIYVMASTGGAPALVTSGPDAADYPDWQALRPPAPG